MNLELINQQLHSSLGKMDLVLGAIDEAIVWTDDKGTIEWCNQSFIKLINRDRISTLGQNLIQLFPLKEYVDFGEEYTLHSAEHPLQKVLQSKQNLEITSLYNRENENRIVESHIHYLNAAPTAPSIIMLIHDITERIKSEEQKNIQEKRLELVMTATQDGFWDMDLTNDQVFHSSRCKEMLGYNAEDKTLEHTNWLHDILAPEDRERVLVFIQDHIKDNKAFHIDCRLQKKDKSFQWFLVRGKALYDKRNQPIRIVGTIVDITERKQIDQMKNEFISTVSHELRTPLTSIRGSLGLIIGNTVGTIPQQIAPLLEIACNNCDRLVRLINDILDIEKIEAKKMVFNFTKSNLKVLIEQSVLANKTYADKYQVDFQLTNLISDSMVLMDTDKIRQVMDNLLSNAAKFSKPGGTVTIKMSKRGTSIQVSVIDNGIGIPKESQTNIFSKFFQADASNVREKGGTGLGLSICKAIIEAHNGTIGFYSTPQVGTIFYFELKEIDQKNIFSNELSYAPQTTNYLNVAQQDSLKKTTNSYHILVCEDDPDVGKLLVLILKQKGFKSLCVRSIAEAKKALLSQNFNLITLDLMLPDGSGLELLKWIRANPKFQEIPVVVVSAVTLENEKITGTALGIIDWIHKPIDEERLFRAVAQIINNHEENKEKYFRPRILHIEDDLDIAQIVSTVLQKSAETHVSTSVLNAKKMIHQNHYDLIILDLNLKDGSGHEILSYMEEKGYNIPIVILSVDELEPNFSKNIAASLVKTRISNTDLLEKIISIIQKRTYLQEEKGT